MAAVTLSGLALCCNGRKGGIHVDGSGNIWVIGLTSTYTLRILKSTDSGASFPSNYDTTATFSYLLESVFDATNGIIYVLVVDSSNVAQIYKFTINTTTWARFDTGGLTVSNGPAATSFDLRTSDGTFIVAYQGTHTYMGSSYQSAYYARCSSAGSWSAGVQLDSGSSTNWYPKGVVIGASNVAYLFWINGSTLAANYNTLSTGNVLGTPATTGFNSSNDAIGHPYYDSNLGLIYGPKDVVSRFSSPNWTDDANNPSNGLVGQIINTNDAASFAYDNSTSTLYCFFRGSNDYDVYSNQTTTTTWGTATNRVVMQYSGPTPCAYISSGVIGYVYSDGANNVVKFNTLGAGGGGNYIDADTVGGKTSVTGEDVWFSYPADYSQIPSSLVLDDFDYGDPVKHPTNYWTTDSTLGAGAPSAWYNHVGANIIWKYDNWNLTGSGATKSNVSGIMSIGPTGASIANGEAIITIDQPPTGSDDVGVGFMGDDSYDYRGYLLLVTATEAKLMVGNGTSAYNLLAGPWSVTPGTGDKICIQKFGTYISAWYKYANQDWELLGGANSSAWTDAKPPWLRITGASARLDDFAGADTSLIYSFVDQRIVSGSTTVTSVEYAEYVESAVITNTTEVSSAEDYYEYLPIDEATVSTTTEILSSEEFSGGISYTDSATIPSVTEITSEEIYGRTYLDSNTVVSVTYVTSVDIYTTPQEYIDAETITSITTLTSSETYTHVQHYPQDTPNGQIAIGSDGSFHWRSNGTWYTAAWTQSTVTAIPQDCIRGQVAIGTDGSFHWYTGTEWHTFA